MGSPQRIAVTGASGFIGTWVTRALAARGDVVVPLARGADVPAGLDAAILLAWYARPNDYLTAPQNTAALRDTIDVVERLLAAGCRKLVIAGSCAEYAPLDRPRREDDPIVPATLYASCKAAASLVTRALADAHGAALAWARVFHVHGPGEDPARLIPWVARSLRAREVVALSPGQQVRDHLHVEDVASALVALVGATGPFNVCSGEPVTLEHVLRTVADVVGHAELLRFGARPYAPTEVMFVAGDPARLHATGWRRRHGDLRAGLAYLGAA